MTTKKQFYASNAGLGYEEYDYFIKIGINKYLCVGSQVRENEPFFSMGDIVTTSKDGNDKFTLTPDELVPVNHGESSLNSNILSLIIIQEQEIKELKKENELLKNKLK